MEPFIGQIQLFGFNFAPRGWAKCEGQLLAIAQNQALFSLLGTTYGGDGRTTFGLPDLRARVPVGIGNGPGVGSITWGEKLGARDNTLNVNQLPHHTHSMATGTVTVPVSEEDADQDEAAGKFLANGTFYHNSPSGTYGTGPLQVTGNTSAVGANQQINNMQPSLGMNYCIALVGIFPSRN